MTRTTWTAWTCVALVTGLAPTLGLRAVAAQTPRPIDIGRPPGDTSARRCATDSILTAALAAYNSQAAVHASGSPGADVPAGLVINGGYGMYRGNLRIDGTVQGNVVVLNGDLRVRSTGTVTGTIIVIGGTLTIDPGARVATNRFACDERVPLVRLSDNTIARSAPTPSIGSIRSALTLEFGGFHFTPHVGVGQYNRSEGLPIPVGVNAYRAIGSTDSVRGELFGIVRTARDPSGSRSSIGWWGTAAFIHSGDIPYTVTIAGGSRIESTLDQPYTALESGLSALVLRRDYNDWFLNRGVSLSASIRPTKELTVAASIEANRQTTVSAVNAFSLLRNDETWRPNPLIDDGKYRIVTGSLTWDARDEQDHPGLTWFARASLHRVTSNNLTPVSLPTSIRDALPISAYGATDLDFDVRASLRLDPEQRLNFRLSGGGYIAGDPLTIQNRRAIGGADPLLGYEFRAVNCDHQRKVYASRPALCDRSLAVQAEYRRTLPVDIGTQIGGQNIGIRNPDLVFLGEAGSAWLAGSVAGRVPNNRIQALREWRSDIGVGIASGPLGLYLSKALADALPLRLTLLFHSRL